MSDLQSAQARRAMAVERLEALLGRDLTIEELYAYQIAWNDGMAYAIEQHKRMLVEALAGHGAVSIKPS